ncbi:glycerol kinase GlpK [Conexibacter arvalis]|uniref:Glycerol kinase n=1 Tax=Conexibacter arvalis TaxID=912552 RepID=A0A840IGZ5_9ACTN|nr:glycerol kinase GlpK [Conexibacter arvalis]MBB4664046.1 glycerol kinase [Conexibacter arvalis]
MAEYVGAIDQGTSSSRFIIFDTDGNIVGVGQREHRQIHPRAGWVEHDPDEIRQRIREVIAEALGRSDVRPREIKAIGITNQRETTVLWDKNTGKPVYNAIVWQDTRTSGIVAELARDGGPDRLREICGLPLSTYFSGPKAKWILDNVEGVREKAEAGDVLFGTMDTYVIWNLTGGTEGGVHVTDVTNASRTMLMDLRTLDWSDEALSVMGLPRAMLPEIRSSSEVYGETKRSVLDDVPISGVLGDQQAALFGQACFEPGTAKNTYGTGSFLLVNTGNEPVPSEKLLTTVGYKIGDQDAVYALEGSIAVTGAGVQWLRDQLGIIRTAPESEGLAAQVEDTGDVYFVPAFSGLFAPYWRDDARGVLVGLTAYTNKAHITRAVLESTAWQSREVVDAANEASEAPFKELKVDGGMVANELLMQFQADVLGVPTIRPTVSETTALGAAYAAGIAVGVWRGTDDVTRNWGEDKRWEPNMDSGEVEQRYARWREAVQRTLGWARDGD